MIAARLRRLHVDAWAAPLFALLLLMPAPARASVAFMTGGVDSTLSRNSLMPVRDAVTTRSKHAFNSSKPFLIPAARTWNGSTSTDWGTAGNWTGGLPGAADDVTIPSNLTNYPVVTATANAKTITMSSGAGNQPTLTVSSSTLTVAGNVTVSAGTITINGGTLANTTGAASITGTVNISSGTWLGSVAMTVNTGGNVNVSSTGLLHMASSSGANPTAAITIAAGGAIALSGGTLAVKDFTTTSGSPNGTVTQTGGTFKLYHDFKGTGTYNATAGTFEFDAAGGGASFPGTLGPTQFYNVVVAADPALASSGAFSVSGNWTANAAADLSGSTSTVTFNGSANQSIGGSATTTFPNVVINNPAKIVTIAQTEAIAGTLTVTAGELDYTAGSSTIGVVAANGGLLKVTGGTTTVAGNVTVGASGTVTLTGGTFAETAGAGSVTGVVNVSGGTWLESVNLTVNNGGNVNVSSGTLHMATAIGTTPSDNIIISSGGNMSLSGGGIDVHDFTTAAGPPVGTLTQTGGLFKQYHDFKSAGTFNSTGGTIEFAAAGGGANFPATLGATQFNNVVMDVDPGFDNQAIAFSVAGDWTSNATVDMSQKGTTVTFNGSGAQSIAGTSPTTFDNLAINKPSGAATLTRSDSIRAGNLTVSSGTLDLSTFTLNRTTAGGTLTVGSGATLIIGGTNGFPSNFSSHTLSSTSTVEYNGTNQTVSNEAYGNLVLSGSGTASVPGGTISGSYSIGASCTVTASGAFTFNGDFTVASGGIFNAGSYSHIFNGNFSNSGTFNASTSTATFSGTSGQTISGSTRTSFNNLTINNSTGVTLGSSETVNGTMTFTSGNVTTSSNVLIIGPSGSVTQTSGFTVGNLRKQITASGSVSKTFEVGTGSNYTPVTVAITGVAGQASDSTQYLTVSATSGDHPNIGSSNLNASHSVNRYWTITRTGSWTFTNYAPVFTFVAGDVDAGASTGSLLVAKYNGSAWTYPTIGTRNATNTQATGITSFSDFELGENGGTTATWTGASSNLWSVGGNWTGLSGTAPVAGNDLIFPNGAANLSNSNDIAAATSFNSISITGSGYMLAGNSITLGAGNLSMSTTSGADSVSLPMVFGATRTLTVTDAASSLVFSGVISGATFGLTKAGAGTLKLSGTNTYGGATTINAGAVSINADAGLGTAPGSATPGQLSFGGGTLITTAGFTLNANRGIALNSGGGTIDVAASTTLVYAGIITGSNPLTKTSAGSLTLSSATLTVSDFTLSAGTVTAPSANSFAVSGNWANSGTFTHNNGTVTLNGGSAQTISGSSTTSFNSLTLNNSSGLTLSTSATINGVMTFTSGKVTTGSNALYIATGGSVSRTSGHVIGNFKKYTATGATSLTFEIGDASTYTPVTVAFASVTVAGDLTAKTTAGDHPNIAGSNVSGSKSVNRYWTLTNSGITFTTYGATFTFVAGDIDGGASTSNFSVGKYSGGVWSYPTVGTKTGTTTQATGITAFSDFVLGELGATYTMTVVATSSSVSRLPSSGTNYTAKFVFTNTGNVTDSYDLLITKLPGTYLTTVSQVGTLITQGANKDSARVTNLSSNAIDTVTVTYSVAMATNNSLDTLVMTVRSVGAPLSTATDRHVVTIVRPLIVVAKTRSPGGNQAPAIDLTYSDTVTNNGGYDATSTVLVDSLSAHFEFKVGSVTNSFPVGVTVAYSNDGGSTWTYTPANGACSAAAGYDRCVNRIRWTLSAPLTYSGSNSGNTQYIVRIR